MLAETESLKTLAGQPQELQKNRGSNKRKSFIPDEGSSRKRFKVSHFDARPETDKSSPSIFTIEELEASSVPEVPSAHTDPLPAVLIQSNRVVERTRHAIEQCWGARRDNRDDNGEGGEVEDNDDNEDNDDMDNYDMDNYDEDNYDEDDDDRDNDNGDNDNGDYDDDNEDGDIEAENNILGLSTWDLLGGDFEREAAALGLS